MESTPLATAPTPPAEVARTGSRSGGLGRAWASVAILTPVIAALLAKSSLLDLAYQVRAGSHILTLGVIPRIDTWTFTAFGKPWVDQQWLAQVVLAGVYRVGGWPALAVARGVGVGAAIALLYLACRWRGASARIAALFSALGFIMALPFMNLRPQLFAAILFSATLWILASRHAHPGRLWALPLLAVVWANVHGSFVLLPLLGAIAWLEDLRDHDPVARRVLLVSALCVPATLVNPFGIHVWSYVWDISRDPQIRKGVTEWEPPTLADWPGRGFWFSVAVAVAVMIWRRRYVRLTDVLTVGLLGIMAADAIRAMLWWGLAVATIGAGLFPEKPRPTPATTAPRKEPSGAPILVALIVLLVIALPWWRGARADLFFSDAPVGLSAAAERLLPDGARVFTPQGWTSWFEQDAPNLKTFVDARIEIYGPTTWADYFTAIEGRPGWGSVLSEWKVDAVVVRPTDGLAAAIARDPRWRLAARDADGMLYVRNHQDTS